MKGKLVKDISAGMIQVVMNQALGLLIFIIISRYLNKTEYGELNWSLAILTFVTAILSLRLEQIVVRKVAAGKNASKILSLFFGHVLFSGCFFYILLLSGSLIFPSFFSAHSLLLALGISQVLSFFSSPFKQLANGKENFGWLALMSAAANFVRAGWLLWIILFSELDLRSVLVVYIVSSAFELFICIYLAEKKIKVPVRLRWAVTDYLTLLKESLPQVGVVFLNACIARIDWILLGIFSTQIITAEYSFAYKMFELSPVPLLILGPILLSRFSKYFSNHTEISLGERKQEISFIIRIEMILATIFPLVLNMVWSPLMDLLTHNKYGAVNKTTFLLLSFCIPLQYLINFFWTIHFSLDHLALVFRITAVTCFVIVTGDLIMIPLFNAKGAAIVYLGATAIECLIYVKLSVFTSMRNTLFPMITCMSIALISGVLADMVDAGIIIKLFAAVAVYCSLLVAMKMIKRNDMVLAKQWIRGDGFKLKSE